MATAKKKELNYQALQQELDQLLADLRGGQLSIDQALKAYERGMVIIKEMENYLTNTQNEVAKLKARFDT